MIKLPMTKTQLEQYIKQEFKTLYKFLPIRPGLLDALLEEVNKMEEGTVAMYLLDIELQFYNE